MKHALYESLNKENIELINKGKDNNNSCKDKIQNQCFHENNTDPQ